MTSALIGALRVALGMDSAAFEEGVDAADRRMRAFQRSMQQAGQSMQRIGQRLTLGVTMPLLGIGTMALQAARESEQASAKVTAALASMGDGAGYTQDQLEAMAAEMADGSIFQDDDILGNVIGNLLTFGNVTGEVFPQATQLALDMSAALGTDLQGASIMLGKALNDPITGLSSLSEVGVSFTEQQKEQIRTMAEAGNLAGAQGIIIGELSRQYAGMEDQLSSTDSGKLTQAWNSISDALESAGDIILPVASKLAEYIKAAADGFKGLDKNTQQWLITGGGIAAAVGPALIAFGKIADAIGRLTPLFLTKSGPIGLAIIGFGALAFAISQNGKTAEEWGNDLAEIAFKIGDALGIAFQKVGDAIAENLPTVISHTIQGIGMMLRDFGIWLATDFAPKAIQGLGMAFMDGAAYVSESFGAMMDSVSASIEAWLQDWYDWGVELVKKLIDGMTSMIPSVQGVVDQIKQTVPGLLGNPEIDQAVADGFDVSSPGSLADYNAAGQAVGDAFTDGVRDALEIKSPSRVMQEIGRFVMAGMGLGIQQGTPDALASMRAASEGIADQMRSGTAGAFDSVTESLDALSAQSSDVFEGIGRWLVDLQKGATTLGETLTNVLGGWSNSLAQSGMEGLSTNLSAALGVPLGGTITGILGGLMGFKDGGSFEVGGVGGIDSQIVAFRASPNETVSVTKPGQDMGGPQEVGVRISFDENFQPYAIVERIADSRANAAVQQAGVVAYQQNRRNS